MSTITSGTVLGAGLLYDSDTTGNLVIKTGPSAATAATFHGNTATTFNGEVYLTNISTPLRPLVSGTANASISGGTVVDFPTIPSWAKRVTVMLNQVSTSGTSRIQFQLGTGGVATTSGYVTGISFVTTTNNETRAQVNLSTGFVLISDAAADVRTGAITFNLMTGNTWAGTGIIMSTGSNNGINHATGVAPLAGTLNMVRITTVNGTDTFDAGTINIMWEG